MLWDYLSIERGEADLAAIAAYLHTTFADTLLARVYPGVSRVAQVSDVRGVPGDVEQLMRLSPDAVVVPAGYSAPLDAVGLPTVSYGGRMISEMDEMIANWRQLAGIAGQTRRERELEDIYHREIGRIESEIDAIPARPKLKVLYLYGVSEGTYSAATAETADAAAVELLQATNLAPLWTKGRSIRKS